MSKYLAELDLDNLTNGMINIVSIINDKSIQNPNKKYIKLTNIY